MPLSLPELAHRRRKLALLGLSLQVFLSPPLRAQQASAPAKPLPDAPSAQQTSAAAQGSATLAGDITDLDGAAIPQAHVALEDAASRVLREAETDTGGGFRFADVVPGRYTVRIRAHGFASWKVENVLIQPGESATLPTVVMGVEALSSTVNAITVEDLAEEQITAEEQQRILGILPNFYVSYVPNAAPLTRKQKFKLALRVSDDPITFMTTGITAGIEQAQGDLSGYGPGFGGYASRFAASYGDRLSSTFFGAALLPSLFHQDPRYFYKGTGSVASRALYAISTVVICKGDNGHWQPNYSNVLGNLAAGGISTFYYPRSDQHSVQVTVDNTLIGTATGAFGTLFQEFLLRHFTHNVPKRQP